MHRIIVRLGLALIVIVIAGLVFVNTSVRNFTGRLVPTVEAGNLSNPTWVLSSTTESATNVTYTHSFTTATAMPSGSEVFIEVRTPPGPATPLPDFGSASLATGTTAGLLGRSLTINYSNGNSLTISVTTNAAIAAGSITMKFSAVNNPSSGATFITNTSTSNAGRG